MPGAAVSIRGVSRRFRLGSEEVWALHGVSIEVAPGEFLALIGRSGSGKTTLLNLIAGLDKPTEGDVVIDGRSVPAMSEKELNDLRRHTLGFVFQSFGLLPLLSAYENVELPLRIAGVRRGERGRRAKRVLELVGLGKRAEHRPYELSGGEQQRVAIARALAIQPSLILADEPTGELDSATATAIFTLMRDIARSEGVTIITSTHDRLVMEMAGRVEELANGRRLADQQLLRHVTARERSPFAAPLAAPPATVPVPSRVEASDEGAEPAPVIAEPAAMTRRPGSLIGADLSQFARPEADGVSPPSEPATATGDALPVAREPHEERDAEEESEDVMRWAPPERRT